MPVSKFCFHGLNFQESSSLVKFVKFLGLEIFYNRVCVLFLFYQLLGLDGSFRFLEHVIWLICLNSVLILGFGMKYNFVQLIYSFQTPFL